MVEESQFRTWEWHKLGRVFQISRLSSWAQSGTLAPSAIDLGDGRIRVYFATRDAESVGRVGYADVSSADPRRTLEVADHPCLDIGRPGMFDDNGVTPLCVIRKEEELWMYYYGWQLSARIRYFLFTGLAISKDGGESFRRVQEVPILDRIQGQAILRSGGVVVRNEEGWRMWFMGGDRTTDVAGKTLPTYEMRYIQSSDGVRWPGPGDICLRPETPDEFGFGRPAVVRDGGTWRMWYSVRTRSVGYRIGYAESLDAKNWKRLDTISGLGCGPEEWDSRSVEYASIVDTESRRFMFYNGNDYGDSGIGVAEYRDLGVPSALSS